MVSSKRTNNKSSKAQPARVAETDDVFDPVIDDVTLEMSVSMSQYHHNTAPSGFVDEYTGAVKVFREDLDNDVEVGKFTAYRCNRMSAHDYDVCDFDLFDAHAPACEYLEVLPTLKRDGRSMDVLIIHKLEVFREYRGKGIGLMAMQVMIKRLASYDCSMALILPAPLQYNSDYVSGADPRMKPLSFKAKSDDLARRKLCKHYARIGFKRIPRTSLMSIDLIGLNAGPRVRLAGSLLIDD